MTNLQRATYCRDRAIVAPTVELREAWFILAEEWVKLAVLNFERMTESEHARDKRGNSENVPASTLVGPVEGPAPEIATEHSGRPACSEIALRGTEREGQI